MNSWAASLAAGQSVKYHAATQALAAAPPWPTACTSALPAGLPWHSWLIADCTEARGGGKGR